MTKNTKLLYGDKIGSLSLVSSMGNDSTIVNAARVSYGKDFVTELSEDDEKLIKFLADNGHTSPFEHCAATFKAVVPLFVAKQHMRHRTLSYNEISRRYTSRDIRFYVPTAVKKQSTSNKQGSDETAEVNPILGTLTAVQAIKQHTADSTLLYTDLLSAGVSRETARMVLPQNLYTEYYFTGNLLNCVKFVNIRNGEDSQAEIRALAKATKELLLPLFPVACKLLFNP